MASSQWRHHRWIWMNEWINWRSSGGKRPVNWCSGALVLRWAKSDPFSVIRLVHRCVTAHCLSIDHKLIYVLCTRDVHTHTHTHTHTHWNTLEQDVSIVQLVTSLNRRAPAVANNEAIALYWLALCKWHANEFSGPVAISVIGCDWLMIERSFTSSIMLHSTGIISN